MNTRKGLGKGMGIGYKNIAPMDAHIHSLSAKGVKTYFLQPYNEGQELNYIETYKGTREGAGKRQRQMRNSLQKILKDGEIKVAILNENAEEISFNAKGSEIAKTIYEQLGGNRFRVMTGAKDFYHDDEKQEIGFKIGRNAKNVNFVRIRLNGKDLYDMEFIYASVKGIKVKSKANDVYNDQLQEVFTEHTGMATHL